MTPAAPDPMGPMGLATADLYAALAAAKARRDAAEPGSMERLLAQYDVYEVSQQIAWRERVQRERKEAGDARTIAV